MSRDIITPSLDYIRKLYAPQDALLEEIDSMLRARGVFMHIGPDEGKLLQLLIGLHGVKTLVEMGTLAGYSTIWMARAIAPEGQVYTIENDAKHAAMAKGYFDRSDVKDRITLMEGNAHDVLPQLSAKGPFDMVFIDADKNGYNSYLDWAEENVRSGGIIVADNTLLFGTIALNPPPKGISQATWEGMRLFNERLADSSRFFSSLIPTHEGMTVAVKLF